MSGLATATDIEVIFQSYRRNNTSVGLPAAGELSRLLNQEAVRANASGHPVFLAGRTLPKLFASAAVEMWHRALHSFIVSAGLTVTSPIWASVAGYYASHYVVRGYAHLLGRYILYKHKRVATLFLQQGQFYCQLDRKGGSDREHRAYWKFVRASVPFGSDPFFQVDNELTPVSDQAHRTLANYYDHIGNYPIFHALTLAQTVTRIERLGAMSLSALPVPDATKYPDLESVQVMAYHRIVRFRQFLDNLLADKYNFWNTHRRPHWCNDIVDFQVTEPELLAESRL